MVFVTIGAGGGTASGAGHIVAEIAKELGSLGRVRHEPFAFEGDKRRRYAEALLKPPQGCRYFDHHPNDRLLQTIDAKRPC